LPELCYHFCKSISLSFLFLSLHFCIFDCAWMNFWMTSNQITFFEYFFVVKLKQFYQLTKTLTTTNFGFGLWRLPCYDISSLTCLFPFAELLMLIYNRTRWKMQKVYFKLQLQDGVICFCVTTRSCMKACEARLC